MPKSQSFSIRLLKQNFSIEAGMKKSHKFRIDESLIYPEAIVYISDVSPSKPLWADTWDVKGEVKSVTSGAVIFLKFNDRVFCFTYGCGHHQLNKASFEPDFGLKIALNCIDPLKVKSIDIFQIIDFMNQLTTIVQPSDLSRIGFSSESEILKRIEGKVKVEYSKIFSRIKGADSLHIATPINFNKMSEICDRLLIIYSSDEYKKTFPDVDNISRVKDQALIARLDAELISRFKKKQFSIEIDFQCDAEHEVEFNYVFAGLGRKKLEHDSINIEKYYSQLKFNKIKLSEVTVEHFKNQRIHATCVNDDSISMHRSVYECLVCEVNFTEENKLYFLHDGQWYVVDKDYLLKLNKIINSSYSDRRIPPFITSYSNENDYNKMFSQAPDRICLDRENIAPRSQKAVEPCDVCELGNDQVVFFHVKRGVAGTQLSHLLNQGLNAIELLLNEPKSLVELRRLIEKHGHKDSVEKSIAMIQKRNITVCTIILAEGGLKNKTIADRIPLLSRISLHRAIKSLQNMGVSYELCIGIDESS